MAQLSHVNPTPLLVTLFEEGGHTIRYKIIDNTVWICARDLAPPLGKTDNAIQKQIDGIRDDWKALISVHTPGGIQNMQFVNKPGAIKIILKTRTKPGSMIDAFQDWAAEKLDELLTTGKTSLKQQLTDLATDWTRSLAPIMRQDTTSPTTKTFASAMVYNTLQRINTVPDDDPDKEVPMGIENRLILNHGLTDPDQIRSYSIGIGKKASAEYQKRYQETPMVSDERVWNQMKTAVKIYNISDYEEWLDDIIIEHIQNHSKK